MLAERARGLAVCLIAAAGIAPFAVQALEDALLTRNGSPEPVLEPVIERRSSGCNARYATQSCPDGVRAWMQLEGEVTYFCARGRFPEPALFVAARYGTTEAWERIALLADDGRVIVPMVDRPLPKVDVGDQHPMFIAADPRYELVDRDHDGVDEVQGVKGTIFVVGSAFVFAWF
jgi:hypothetical protein